MVASKIGPLLVIVGPTASGKSALAIDIAMKFNGEIICADSRTVYRGMDVGTAKPTEEEQATVKHHLIDIKKPDEKFNASEFKKLAQEAIKSIHSRSKLPILAGGSGLYVDSILFDYDFNPKSGNDPENPRHRLTPGTKQQLRSNTLILGLDIDRDSLKIRIHQRVEEMIKRGVIDEASKLLDKYGPNTEAFNAPGYKPLIKYLKGEISLEQAKRLFEANDLALAKRQMTWFKRNKSIHWLNDREIAVELVTTFLNK